MIQRLQSIFTEQRTISEYITLVVTLDSLYDNFEIITAFFLYSGDTNLEKIQQIVTFTEVANLTKQIVGVTAVLALIAKKKQPERVTKSNLEEEYFNYGKKGHYAKDYFSLSYISNKKKSEKSMKKAKRSQ